MATSILSAVLLLLLSIAATASGRPCKTLFYISATTTTTTAFYPQNSLPRNTNTLYLFPNRDPRYLTLIFSSKTSRIPAASLHNSNLNPEFYGGSRLSLTEKLSDVPANLYSSISSSIGDRSRDIMSVFGALLFGVGCGGIAAAIMYVSWALFSLVNGRFDLDDVSSSSDDDDDDHVAAMEKRLGYVVIPSQPKLVDDDDLKKPAPVPEIV